MQIHRPNLCWLNRVHLTLLALSPVLLPMPVMGQGSLTPPGGAPGPVMRTLQQVEARIPVEEGSIGVTFNINGTIDITESGNYYLTGDLNFTLSQSYGIDIQAQDVTLDLNGFALVSTDGLADEAIKITTAEKGTTTIINGKILGASSWSESDGGTFTSLGWTKGILCSNSTLVVRNLEFRGLQDYAIQLSGTDVTCLVESVAILDCAGGVNALGKGTVRNSLLSLTGFLNRYGIYSSIVSGCSVQHVTGPGILADEVIDSQVSCLAGTGAAIQAYRTVSNCYGNSIGGNGIYTNTGSVMNSSGQSSANGIGCYGRQVMNCVGSSSSGNGLSALVSATNCYGETSTGTYGLYAGSTASFCYGTNASGGTALSAPIAVACRAGVGTISSGSKQLGTP